LLSVQWINSWWWTGELSETCRVSYQNQFVKLVRLVGFIIKKFVTMHGHMNVKKRFVICLLVDTLVSAGKSPDVCTGDPKSKYYYPIIINCDFVTIRHEIDQVVTSVHSSLPITPSPGFGNYFLNERFLCLRLPSPGNLKAQNWVAHVYSCLFAVSMSVTIDSVYQISHML
jgi:hypothetical protein